MIAGRYQLLEPARAGAPQRARDHQTAQTVLLREAPSPTETARQRARAAKGIFHPSLVTLFDVTDLPGGALLLAYEFVPAQSLRAVSGGQPFHPRRAAQVVGEIADAAAALHGHGVAHGGIGIDTILITMKGKAKLDRAGDPALAVPVEVSEANDLQALLAVLRELAGGQASPIVNAILRREPTTIASAAVLAASLRAAAGR